jgi:hypothetical protein
MKTPGTDPKFYQSITDLRIFLVSTETFLPHYRYRHKYYEVDKRNAAWDHI